jgi:hypothetical protein
METTGWLDWMAGILAIGILLGGLIMLLKGVAAMNRN